MQGGDLQSIENFSIFGSRTKYYGKSMKFLSTKIIIFFIS